MKTFIVAVLIIIGGTSCVTQSKCYKRFPLQTSTDSVYIEKIKEVPVYLPGDTVNVEVPINCPDQDIVLIENAKLKQQIKIINGKLISLTNIKPDTIKVPVPEIHETINVVKVPEPVRYIPKIYKNAMSICIFIFSIAFIYIGWRAYKFFKK